MLKFQTIMIGVFLLLLVAQTWPRSLLLVIWSLVTLRKYLTIPFLDLFYYTVRPFTPLHARSPARSPLFHPYTL
ncbi:MAG: hypothetical protein GDA48_00375 [Hormoscilla sp. GM102CHS1]|nr:hypothetical protein [Hormoscilla sp. GM102CHS1]